MHTKVSPGKNNVVGAEYAIVIADLSLKPLTCPVRRQNFCSCDTRVVVATADDERVPLWWLLVMLSIAGDALVVPASRSVR